eukprot:scaffold7518_cov350-Prasinococcus_capsulatus_cf.AAC.1
MAPRRSSSASSVACSYPARAEVPASSAACGRLGWSRSGAQSPRSCLGGSVPPVGWAPDGGRIAKWGWRVASRGTVRAWGRRRGGGRGAGRTCVCACVAHLKPSEGRTRPGWVARWREIERTPTNRVSSPSHPSQATASPLTHTPTPAVTAGCRLRALSLSPSPKRSRSAAHV